MVALPVIGRTLATRGSAAASRLRGALSGFTGSSAATGVGGAAAGFSAARFDSAIEDATGVEMTGNIRLVAYAISALAAVAAVGQLFNINIGGN